MHSPGRFRPAPRHVPRWDTDADEDEGDTFLSASDLVKTLQPVPRRPTPQSRGRPMTDREPPASASRRWPPPSETQQPLGFNDWAFDESPGHHEDSRAAGSAMDYRSRTSKGGPRGPRGYGGDQLDFDPDVLQEADEYETNRARAFQMGYDVEPRHSQAQLQRYNQQRQHQRVAPREFGQESSSQFYRRPGSHPEHELYVREMRGREPMDDMQFDSQRRAPRSAPSRDNGLMRDTHARALQSRRYNAAHSPGFGPRMDELPLEPAMLDMYPDGMETPPSAAAQMARRREYAQSQHPTRQRMPQQMPRRPHSSGDRLNDEMMTGRRPFNDPDMPRDRRGGESRALYEELAPTPTSTAISQSNYGAGDTTGTVARQRSSQSIGRPQLPKRQRSDDSPSVSMEGKASAATKSVTVTSTPPDGKDAENLPKRRCGRKSMNYSTEQKRERNRAAVKKCRQRQALKLEYLQHKAESLAAENQALSEMLVKNAELDEEQRTSLTRGIQMDILLKIKEIFTQSLPKDFVLDADSIWDLNSVLAVSMPSRCYYGIESIKDFWRTSLRMRNKGKIRSFWAWLFRLPPGDRFSEFDIQPFSPTSNLYFISWTTKSKPPLAGSMVIMFGNGHRVTLHVECFGWLIWRYLLTNEPFPEPVSD
ncbi:hypothetical protein L914_05292 [Phytophthora nicotianae]|uniref:BZIP domain-containing protein n=1 Tax=Phytophthora nicotianae TaxID=4792 RepID=W2NS36_PHYNI|nr:hypothetical protein L914_05292 [Phytophthora nicotianae]